MAWQHLVHSTWLLAVMLASPQSATPADSARWLPLFDSASGGQVIGRVFLREPCFHGEFEPGAIPPIERRRAVAGEELREFARALFRSLLDPAKSVARPHLTSWGPDFYGLELSFRARSDSVHLSLDQVWSTDFSGALVRRRSGVVVDSIAIRRIPAEVAVDRFGLLEMTTGSAD